jgi:hypothetical protein
MRGSIQCFLLATVVATAGCGAENFVPVSGTVTLDGQPFQGAVVQFEPVASRRGALGSTAVTDANGRYELQEVGSNRRGAVVGTHRIRVFTAPPEMSPNDNLPPEVNERIPDRYHAKSDVTFEVPAAGSLAADFKLTTR